MANLPIELQNFIRQYIRGIDVVEVILLLKDNPGKDWDPPAVSRALAIDRERARQQLDGLTASGLASRTPLGSETVYCYRPDSTEKDEMVSELALAYRNFPVQVSNLLYSAKRTDKWGT